MINLFVNELDTMLMRCEFEKKYVCQVYSYFRQVPLLLLLLLLSFIINMKDRNSKVGNQMSRKKMRMRHMNNGALEGRRMNTGGGMSKNTKMAMLFILVLLLIGLGVGLYFGLRGGSSTSNVGLTPGSSTTIPSPGPSP